MNFIKNRLNRDNFWNLMFWLLMTTGLYSSFLASELHMYLATTLLWLTVIGVPLLVKKFAKVTLNENSTFVNSEGKVLNTKYLKLFSLAIVATIILFVATGSIIDSFKHSIPDSLACFIMLNVFFFVPTLYFILINSPISIIFNKNIWSKYVVSSKYSPQVNSSIDHIPVSSLSPGEWSTSPAYSNLSSNIYHRR